MQSIATKGTGDSLTAVEWNGVPDELENAIADTGQTLSGGDLFQMSKAMSTYAAGGTFYTDSGAADAYVLTTVGSKRAPTAYFDGMQSVFWPGNPNTGPSTVNVSGLGVKNITDINGNALAGGEIDEFVEIRYDLANDRFEKIRNRIVTNLINITTSGTYSKPNNLLFADITAIGAGAGGGGVDGQGSGTTAVAPGGGSGAFCNLLTDVVPTSLTVVIGASGVGGAAGNNNGTDGGDTTVVGTGINLSAGGGIGGSGSLGISGSTAVGGGSGGTATGGDSNFDGNAALSTTIVSGDPGSVGHGAPSVLGGAVKGAVTNIGATATVPGASGSGAGSRDLATNFAGGDGADGIVIIKEYLGV